MPRGRPAIHREALLEGALVCLQERGFARTTARDIVAASGANLGAIGYHYGSTERLLNQALLLGFERWMAELETVLRDAADDLGSVLTTIARELPATFERHRPLVRALLEAMAQAEHSPEIREELIASYRRGRELVRQLIPAVDAAGDLAPTLASLVLGLYDGLLFQWLIDPEHAPTAADLTQVAALIEAAARQSP